MTRKGYTVAGPGYLVRDDGKVEAVRYWAGRDGFAGWVVRSTSDRYSYSDPIPTKAEAVAALLAWDREVLGR